MQSITLLWYVESQNHEGWNKPLRSSSPTVHLPPIFPTILKNMESWMMLKYEMPFIFPETGQSRATSQSSCCQLQSACPLLWPGPFCSPPGHAAMWHKPVHTVHISKDLRLPSAEWLCVLSQVKLFPTWAPRQFSSRENWQGTLEGIFDHSIRFYLLWWLRELASEHVF